MNHYKYRWFYALAAAAITCLLGVVGVIYPDWQQFMDGREAVRNLSGKLQALSDNSEQRVPIPVLTPEQQAVRPLSVLTVFAHLAGLSVQSVQRAEAGKELLFHFVAQGDFRRVAAFVSLLEKSGSVFISNFASKLTEENKLKLEADILFNFIPPLNILNIAADQEKFSTIDNPFCTTVDVPRRNDSALLASTPLSQMKMTGYLGRGGANLAFILLPNDMVMTVEKGMLLGSERGIVNLVEQDRVVVELPDKTIKIIGV